MRVLRKPATKMHRTIEGNTFEKMTESTGNLHDLADLEDL